jgi:SP family sugar:H+ symporter-like MFS transporter
MKFSMRRDNGDVAPNNGTPESFSKDQDVPRDAYASSVALDSASETSEKQAGVKRIEAVSKSWTKSSLIIAYVT